MVLELLADGGMDGLPLAHLSQVLHGVDVQVSVTSRRRGRTCASAATTGNPG